jgi:hypothetical protein
VATLAWLLAIATGFLLEAAHRPASTHLRALEYRRLHAGGGVTGSRCAGGGGPHVAPGAVDNARGVVRGLFCPPALEVFRPHGLRCRELGHSDDRTAGQIALASSGGAGQERCTCGTFPGRLLQADACTTCGRCNAVCQHTPLASPAAAGGGVGVTRRQMPPRRKWPALTTYIPEPMLWSCTTRGVTRACPVGIEIYDKIMRRGLVESVARRTLPWTFDNTAGQFNPMAKRCVTAGPASDYR